MRALTVRDLAFPRGFNPLTLTPTAWHKFADSSTVTLNSGNVSQIDDKSGNGNHIAQSTAGNQAAYASAVINGQNAWYCTGSNQKRLLWKTSFVLAQPFTIYCVFRSVTRVSNNVVDNATSRITLAAQRPDVPPSYGFFAGSFVSTNTPNADTNAHVLVGVYNGASSSLRLDGAQILTGNVGTNGFNTTANVTSYLGGDGTSAALDMYVAEVLLQPSATVSTEYETLLRSTYGTA